MVVETLAITLVTALATKAFEKVGEKTTESVWNKVKGILPGEELTTLNLFEKYPENKDLQNEVAEKLQTRLQENSIVAEELGELLKKVKSIQVKQNTTSQSGTGNISNQNISNSTINIRK
jgi:hypothetical protein